MSSTTVTAMQAELTDQTVSSVPINNPPGTAKDIRAYSFTVKRFVRDFEDLLKTASYPGQTYALYLANNPAPEWFMGSLRTLTLLSEQGGQPASASQQLIFIDSKAFRSLRELAKEHFQIEPRLQLISVYSQSPPSGFLLIEVNDEAIPTGSVEPFYFAPGEDFGWPVYIADVTRDEWTQIENNTMKLPLGWPSEPMLIFRREEVLRQ